MIKTKKEYQKALQRLEKVFDAPTNSAEGREAELLVLLISEYEKEFYPISNPHPIDAIKVRMEDLNLKAQDLVRMEILSKSSASMILNKKRPLTLDIIRKLTKLLSLPAELLIQDYELESNSKKVA